MKKTERGQTLIEVLAALSILVVLLFGISGAVIFSLNNVQFTKNQNLANHYAEQGMEVVRQIWNSDLATFNSLTGAYCLDKNSSVLTTKDQSVNGCSSVPGGSGQNVDSFAREVDILKNSPDCGPTEVPPPTPTPFITAAKVTIIVSWSDAKCTSAANVFCHKTEMVSCFSKFHTLQEP